MTFFTYQMIIQYDGTKYCGWQKQPNGLTIQQLIEEALFTILRVPLKVIGAGRTDAGVHALGQVAHFRTTDEISLEKTHRGLNGLLPKDIRIQTLKKVSPHFHARYLAVRKSYHYHLHLNQVQDPFQRLYSYHVGRRVDLELLKKAANYFIGTKNFLSFTNEAKAGSAAKNPVRTIYSLEVFVSANEAVLAFEGDGFLYKMVRNIVGLLIEVSIGKIPIETIQWLLDKKDRSFAPPAAPAHGLFLVKVTYPPKVLDDSPFTKKFLANPSFIECFGGK